jgi:predicted Zn-dependent protease
MDSDPALAFEEFKKAFALDPGNMAASLKVAFFNLEQGDPQSAMKLAQHALLKSPADYRVHLVMGRAYLQMNETTKAIAELRRTVEIAPEDSESHYYLAQAYRAAGNKVGTEHEQAEFDRLKKQDNSHTSINGWWYFAGQYYSKHRYADARDALNKIVTQNSRDSAAWGMMGLCDFELDDFPKSLEDLLRARSTGLAADSSLSDAVHFYLAILLNQTGQTDAAIKELTTASGNQNPSPQTHFVMGLIALRRKIVPAAVAPDQRELVSATGEAAWLLNSGHAAEAATKFSTLIEAHPTEPHLHFNYAVCLIVLNDTAGARREFARELEIDPTDAEAQAQLALADIKVGTVENALQEAESAVRLDDNSYLAHNALGWASLANHKKNQAVNEMRQAVRLSPDSAAMHYGLAQALKANGNAADADREMAKFQTMRDGLQSPATAR